MDENFGVDVPEEEVQIEGETDLMNWQSEVSMEMCEDKATEENDKQAKLNLLEKKLKKYRRIAQVITKRAYPGNKNDPEKDKHRKKATELQKPPVFLELFAGEGMLTKVVGQCAATYVPQDVFDGKGNYVGGKMNLLIPENQKRLRTMVRKQEVRWLHCAPPCKTFSRARRSDRWGSAKILRSTEQPMGFDKWNWQVAEANALTKFTARLCRTQLRAGGCSPSRTRRPASCGTPLV